MFGEIGLPDHVENISASGWLRLTQPRQCSLRISAIASLLKPQKAATSDVVALTPDVSVVSILALVLGVLLLSLGLLLGSTLAAG